jgi:diguanylate cyclase (GGDEF)-like protein
MNILKGYRRTILIVFFIIIFYFACSLTGLCNLPKLKSQDIFFRIKYRLAEKPKALNDIVIIPINDSTYKGRWPWDRDIFADLIYKLAKYNPAVIGFDLGFIEESTKSKSSDYLFVSALKDFKNIILASYIDKEGKYIIPYKDFRDAASDYGFTNKIEDADNIIRETRFLTNHSLTGEILDYSFDLKIACLFLGLNSDLINIKNNLIECASFKIPIDVSGGALVNYTAVADDFISIPLEDIIENKITLNAIENKIVLVGVTDEIFHDISLTPLGKMPGVVIIANTIAMLVERDFLHKINFGFQFLFILFISIVVGVLASREHFYRSLITTIFIFVGVLLVNILLILNNFIVDFFAGPSIVVLTYIFVAGSEHARLLMESFMIKKAITVDSLTGLSTRRYFLLKLEKELKNEKTAADISLVLFSIANIGDVLGEAGTEKLDSIVKKTAEIIVRSSRKTRGMDFIARYGQTDFCAVLHMTNKKGALIYAERIRDVISSAKEIQGLNINAGIVNIEDIDYRQAKAFVKCADLALSRAKQDGAGKICMYDSGLDHIDLEDYKKESEFSEIDFSYVTREFEEKNKELVIMLNKLLIANEDVIKSERLSAVGKVAATIHHDLSKPIINLRSSLKMIKDDVNSVENIELESAKRLLAAAVDETERLGKLSDSLKDLYRPIKKEVVNVSINSIFEDMLSLSSAQINKNKIKLIKNLDSAIPLVKATTNELKQVFLNLIINAIESMQDGGELEVTTSLAKDKAGFVEIMIRDTGYGISSDNIPKLFKAFFTTKKHQQGAGLGLYASSEIVKKYGGKISVESRLEEGTIFRIYFPAAM